MNPYILPLADTQADLLTTGGKGMSLARLSRAGIPVPHGFHITTEAYRQFVSHNNLQPGIHQALQEVDAARPASLESASRAIGRLFTQAEIPGGLANAIAEAYSELPGADPAVAVRSSATAEDLPEASFAGQQETYLNVHGADGVLQAAQKCWGSLWTARAIGYRLRQNIPADSVALAVVVQLLVGADAAGILFTANPLNGDRDELVINAAWGLGEAVVSGAVTPDTIKVHKSAAKVMQRETAEKLAMTVRTEDGTEEQPVPGPLKNAPVLSDEKAVELAQIGTQIEKLYGTPMDIEWALADGEFAILQARPVTALPESPILWAPPTPKGTYIRMSIIDLLPKPLSPLFITLWIPAHMEQMQPMGKRMIGSDPVLPNDYFTSINNYAYMNAYFPPASMWWIVTGMLPAYPKLLRNLVPLWRDELHPQYQAFVASKQELAPRSLSAEGLWREAQKLLNAAVYYACGLLFATMGASAGSEGLLTQAYNRLAKRPGDPEAMALLMGWDNIPIRAEKSLYDIARWIEQDETLTRRLLETPAGELTAQLFGAPRAAEDEDQQANGWGELAARLGAHLDRFGHIIFQLDFAEPLPRDHPEIMLETIKMYLRGEGSNPHQRQQASELRRIQTTETMLRRLKGLKLWAFRIALNWGQSMAAVREDALADLGLAFPKLRDLLLELGTRLVAAGAIQDAGDIFWLEKDEVSACVEKLERKQALENLTEVVDQRKAYNARLQQVTPPPMIPLKKRVMGVKTEVFVASSEEEQTGNLLRGVPTSPGVVTAPACVLHGAEDFDQMKPGDVLVAGTTTPAWTPLFAMAAAVVTDIGGPLSHGSIVAREYGIPAVMGTGVATRRIRSGQILTVDGSAGTVKIQP